jgi:alpha-galactosidase
LSFGICDIDRKLHHIPFMKFKTIKINGISLSFLFTDTDPVSLLDTTTTLHEEKDNLASSLGKKNWLVEIQAAGCNWPDHHGNKYTGTHPGELLRYKSHKRSRTELGPKLEIQQTGGGLRVTSHLQFLGKLPAFRSWTVVENLGKKSVLLEYVSTFALAGLSRGGAAGWDKKMRLHVADNTWCGECQWRSGILREFGLTQTYAAGGGAGFSLNRISISNQGSWSTVEYLPMGVLENTDTRDNYFWQIEHNGSWQWEISDSMQELYLRVSGPTYRESLWSKKLAPRQKFESVPATIGRVNGDWQSALIILTQARRLFRQPHPDLKAMPVIFNDYMNCLYGDPTTDKLLPVIDAAATAGCEYFVIDAGWYAEIGETWWESVGAWQPSKSRFPRGLSALCDYIRSKGMVAGLWLEIEVIGIQSPLATKLPDNWFFLRDGKRVIDHGRYQLDFRNPHVRVHADKVVERMIRIFGIGYIKMDYNINAGPGTDYQSDGPGDGLLDHNRAYLGWVREVFRRHPALVIENCSSGGLRLDYAQLAQHSIQSTSDQTDYRLNAVIAAACASAVTPEQAAVWSYPLKDGDEEETIMNMVNALLWRIHQSGRIHEISSERFAMVKEGISLYKTIRKDIQRGLPYWPLGLPRLGDDWAAFGLDCNSMSYLAVWRLGGKSKSLSIPLPQGANTALKIDLVYPRERHVSFEWLASRAVLKIVLPKPYMARLFRIQKSTADGICILPRQDIWTRLVSTWSVEMRPSRS